MKFFLTFFLVAVYSNFVFAAEVVLPNIKKRITTPELVLSHKKTSNSATSPKKNDIHFVEKNEINEPIEINMDKYKSMTRKKQDWNVQLKSLTNDIKHLEEIIQDSKDETVKEIDTKQLYELKYYRSIANTNLKNYGKAIVEAKEVVKFDESYSKRKHAMYFNKDFTFDDIMASIWNLFKTLEDYSCKGGVECKQEVAERYFPKWNEESNDYTHYDNSTFFNNSSFADAKTVMESYIGSNSCTGACLIGMNIEEQVLLHKGAAPSSQSSTAQVCNTYELPNKYTLYIAQIATMNTKILDSTTPLLTKAHSYLCLGFTNIMLLDSGIASNENYIANAKMNIKGAIAANKMLTSSEQIDEIDDIINLDALFAKYNTIATKGMTDEDKALTQRAISEDGLRELKLSLETNNSDIEEYAQTSQYLSDDQKKEIASAYSTNSIADVNGDEKTQTAKFFNKSSRATEKQMNETEVSLQDLLDAIVAL